MVRTLWLCYTINELGIRSSSGETAGLPVNARGGGTARQVVQDTVVILVGYV